MADQSEVWVFRLTIATAAAVLVSIAAAQILLTLTLLAWLVLRPRPIRWPAYFIPLSAFMLTTLLSLAMSADPWVGFGPVSKFVLFSMGLIAAAFVTDQGRIRALTAVMIIVATAASVAAILQFGLQYAEYLASGDLADDPMILARVTGFMGHWMTFSGQQMLVWCAAIPLAFALGSRKYLIPLGIVGVALLLSFTRGVWLGSAAGIGIAALYLPKRQLLRLLIPLGAIALLASPLIAHRISMSFLEGGFAPDEARLAYLDVGIRMIRDNPLFGVGPERIGVEFPGYYRGENLDNFFYGHLHNNFLQLGAERGLLCLAAFVWLLISLGTDFVRRTASKEDLEKWIAVSGLSVLVAFIVAGLFEYNFGDSEVLMLFLFLISLPSGLSEAGNDNDIHVASEGVLRNDTTKAGR